MALVTWLSSQPATTRRANQARTTMGTSNARTSRGCAAVLINTKSVGARRASPSAATCATAGARRASPSSGDLGPLVRGLRGDEEEGPHGEDEETVIDHHLAGQGLLKPVGGEPAV